MAEASRYVLVDTACTKMVAGKKWFKNYTSNLTEKARKEIMTYSSNTSLQVQASVEGLKLVVFPLLISEKHCKIRAKIIVENIPLLSKSSLEKCRTVHNVNDDKATVFDREVTLHQSTSGHYCIDILPVFFRNDYTEEVLVLEADLSHKQKLSQLDKIHKQFGHAGKVDSKC